MKRSVRARWGSIGVIAAVALCALVVVHIERLGQDALAESDQAMASGDATTAIARARDAAMAKAPGSHVPADAYQRLAKIGDEAESRGDFEHAAEAWRAVREALRSTRSEGRETELMTLSGAALVRLAGRVCEGNRSHAPAACSAATQAALTHDDLPTGANLSLLGLGACAFLAGCASALRIPGRRARFVGTAVAFAGVAAAALAVVVR